MINDLKPLFSKFMVFAKDRMQFKNPPRLFLKKDTKNSNCMLGKTAHYDPSSSGITLYISGRHPKDILRSLAHELVHHCQNERGDLAPEKMKTMNKNYAQENEHMRKMEEEAYLQGNMCFRDWEDSLDDKLKYKMHIAEHKFLKENKKMSVKISKRFLKETISKILDQKIISEQEKGGDFTGLPPDLKKVIKAYSEGGRVGAKKKASEIVKSKTSGLSDIEVGSFATQLLKKARKEYSDEYDKAVAAFKNKGKNSDSAVAEEPKGAPQKVEEGMVVPCKAPKGSKMAHVMVGSDCLPCSDPKAQRYHKKYCEDAMAKKELEEGAAQDEDTKINTPEQENELYESRFTNRNTKLFEKLLKEWTK